MRCLIRFNGIFYTLLPTSFKKQNRWHRMAKRPSLLHVLFICFFFFNLNSNNILYLSWFIDNLVQFILPVAVCIKSLSIYIFIYLFCYIFAFLCVLIKLLSFIYRMHWHETIFLLLQSILVLGNIFCYKWFKTCFGFETKKIVLILVCWTVKTTRWLSKYLWYSRNKGKTSLDFQTSDDYEEK